MDTPNVASLTEWREKLGKNPAAVQGGIAVILAIIVLVVMLWPKGEEKKTKKAGRVIERIIERPVFMQAGRRVPKGKEESADEEKEESADEESEDGAKVDGEEKEAE